ncbi:MAG: DivIVA domain-containing protein [Fibromonadales bacterium]|nr:DivIVA domain-containing protein [Fibromonadales bacterium]MCL1957005.1 DivIVA domain-containing protein [Fibromonadales bacterium]
MDLTPLDIRNQKFSKKVNGFDPAEVQAFLNQVATTFEGLLDERADLLKTINNDKKNLDEFRQIEKNLSDAAVLMSRALDDVKTRANKEADLIIAEAKSKAEQESATIKNQATDLRREIDSLRQLRVNYFARLRNLMRTQEDMLSDMEKEDSERK